MSQWDHFTLVKSPICSAKESDIAFMRHQRTKRPNVEIVLILQTVLVLMIPFDPFSFKQNVIL